MRKCQEKDRLTPVKRLERLADRNFTADVLHGHGDPHARALV